MDKTCIINPATGRAVKIDSRLGKKLAKEQRDKPRQDGAKTLQAVVRRKVAKKPASETPKKPASETPKKPAIKEKRQIVPKQPKKDSWYSAPSSSPEKEQAVKTLQSAVRRKVAKKPAPATAKSGRKFDVDYVKRYAQFIKSRFTSDGLEKELKKAKNGTEVKEFYYDYIGPYDKSKRALIAITDKELSTSDSERLLNKVKHPDTADEDVRLIYYSKFEQQFHNLAQKYLFKYEEPAE